MYPMLPKGGASEDKNVATKCEPESVVAAVSPDLSMSRQTLTGNMFSMALYPRALPKLPMSLSSQEGSSCSSGSLDSTDYLTKHAVPPPPVLPRFQASRSYPTSFAALIAADIILRRQQDSFNN